MKIKLLLCALILTSASVFSQKVKIKKKVATIDGQEYLDLTDGDSYGCTYKTINGEEIFYAQYNSYAKKNPIPRNPRSNVPYKETVTEHYSIVKFLSFELEFETGLQRKSMVKALYKEKVIDLNGVISEENALLFQKKYAKDFSSNRPLQIYTN